MYQESREEGGWASSEGKSRDSTAPLVSLDPRLPSFHHFSPLQVESVPELPRPFCHDLAYLPPGSIGEAWRQISGPCKMILLRKGKTVNFQTFTNMG